MRRLITLQDEKYFSDLKKYTFSISHTYFHIQSPCLFFLTTCRGNTVDLSLSGQRALEFDADIGQNRHIIAIFVGTLMKIYREDYKFLSGTSACRWYINENDIPAMRTFQRGFQF